MKWTAVRLFTFCAFTIVLDLSFSFLQPILYKPQFRTYTLLQAKQKSSGSKGSSKKIATSFVSIEDVNSDLWQLEPIIDLLREGQVGVIPTDTCYSFVTPITSREGIEQLMALKGISGKKKPLSIICKDVSTISKYTSDLSNQKWVFKLLKNTLPGPFTYIIPASKEFPKLILDNEFHIRRWKRKEIGVRIPFDTVCSYIMEALDVPLICGSVPEDAEDELGILSISSIINDDKEDKDEDYDQDEDEEDDYQEDYNLNHKELDLCQWFNKVNFVVENGPRGLIIDESSDIIKGKKNKEKVSKLGGLSTIIDLTRGKPVILRQGRGVIDLNSVNIDG